MRWLVACLAAMLLLPASAGAVTLVNPDGSVAQPYQAWASASRVPTVPETLTVYRDTARCATDVLGCAWNGWISLSPVAARRTEMHELGHELDFSMPDWKRRVFAKIDRQPWDAERFADAYADCAMYRRAPALSTMASPRSFQRVCRLIRQT